MKATKLTQSLFLSFIFLLSCNNDDDKIFNPVFTGNVTLTSQKEIDDFGAKGYTEIKGDLILSDLWLSDKISDIKNLKALHKLEIIKNLNVYSCPLLKDFSELENLKFLESLRAEGNGILNFNGLNKITTLKLLKVEDNNSLTSPAGLENLTQINGYMAFRRNKKLKNFKGLTNLKKIDSSLALSNNNSLKNFEGLENLSYIGGWLSVSKSIHSITPDHEGITSFKGLKNLKTIKKRLNVSLNAALKNLSGLENLNEVEKISISSNKSLTKITSLKKLSSVKNISIRGNSSLINIEGFENLVSVDNLSITINPALSNFCALSKVSVNEYQIEENGYNPTKIQLITPECKN